MKQPKVNFGLAIIAAATITIFGCGVKEQSRTTAVTTSTIRTSSEDDLSKARMLVKEVIKSENILREIFTFPKNLNNKKWLPESVVKIGTPGNLQSAILEDFAAKIVPLVKPGGIIEVHHEGFSKAHGTIKISDERMISVQRVGNEKLHISTTEKSLNETVKLAAYAIALEMHPKTIEDISAAIAQGFRIKQFVRLPTSKDHFTWIYQHRLLLIKGEETKPVVPIITGDMLFQNNLETYLEQALRSGFSSASLDMGFQLVALGSPVDPTIRLVSSLQGLRSRLNARIGHPALPRNPLAPLNALDSAIHTFNEILKDAPRDVHSRLANNTIFITIGEILRNMRDVFPPAKK